MSCLVLYSWRYAVCRLCFPIAANAIIRYAGKRLVSGYYGNSNRVDELCGIAIVEGYPRGLVSIDFDREMQRTQGRAAGELEDNELLAAQIGTRVTIGNLAHTLDALRNTHLLVENGTVGGEVHSTDVVRGMGDVGNLHPGIARSVFVNQAGLVLCHHLVQLDAGIHLCQHRKGGESKESAYESESFHFFVLLSINYISLMGLMGPMGRLEPMGLSAEEEHHNLGGEDAQEHGQRVNGRVSDGRSLLRADAVRVGQCGGIGIGT